MRSDDIPTDVSPLLAAVFGRFQGAEVLSVRDAASIDHAAEAAERAARQAAAEVRAREDAWRQEEHRQGFRTIAPACVANGWSLFPQSRGEKRNPIQVLQANNNSRKTLQWKPYQERLPTPNELTWWANSESRENRANAALIMGPISGGALAVDIDVSDPAISEVVLRLADQHLGHTEFRRVGRAPRIVLVYRSDPADPVRNRAYALDAKDAEGGKQAIDILADRKPVTAFGAHHKTGSHFRWVGACRPDTHGPEHAPVIGQAAIEAFVSAVDGAGILIPNLRRALAAGDGPVIDPALVTASGFVRPSVNQAMNGVVWDAQGKIVGGREAYVHSRAYSYVRQNAGLALTEDGPYVLAGLLKDECEALFAPGGAKFKSPQELVRGCRERIDSSVAKLRRGEMQARGIVRDEATGRVTAVPVVPHAVEREESDDLAWLPRERVKLPDDVKIEPANPARAAERALISDAEHSVQAERVATEIVGVMEAFLAEVRRDRRLGADAPVRPVRLLRAPTGAGKSSTAVKVVTDDLAERGPIGGALLFLQPSYDNIHENVGRFQATKRGAMAVFRKNAEAAAKDLPQGTKYLILEGKERGGCLRTEEQRILRSAGISSAGLCKASVEDGVGGSEEKVCPHYDVCPVIAARKKIVEAEVIFAPSAFLTSASLPAGLEKAVAGVVADERTWTEVLRYDTFPTVTLDTERAAPRTYKRDAGETGEDLTVARALAARTAAMAIRKHFDVALTLVAEHGMEKAEAWVDAAVKVTGRAQEAGRKLRPDMTVEQIKALAERPTGRNLREEWRFWKIVAERLLALKMDATARDLRGGVDRLDRDGNAPPGLARGERDYRIQTLDGGANIRISWRAEPNFAEHPVLLLDASADEGLTSKCWGGRDVALTHIEARLNLRTVLLVDRTWRTGDFRMDLAGADKQKRRAVASNVSRTRHAITAAAMLYGHGRIIVGAPKGVRAALMDTWAEMPNVDWMHYGAVRGLDFARAHLAAFSVGRHEFPVRFIDGIVAAATYDDEEPEHPIDAWGDGYLHNVDGTIAQDDRGNELEIRPPQVRRTYPLRHGGSVSVLVSEYEGRWAKVIQAQFREEELAQFAGRLRPVYRTGEAPLWIAGSKVLPHGFVVDDVVSMGDLADPARVGAIFDAIRRTGIADAAVIEARAPDSRLRGTAAAVLQELGLDGADMSGRWSKGMRAVRVEVDGETVERQIPGWVADGAIVAHTVSAYAAAGHEADTVESLGRGAQPAGGYPRSEEGDKVVAEVGTRAARADRELAVRDEVMDRLGQIADTLGKGGDAAWLAASMDMDVQIVLHANPPEDEGEAEVIPLRATAAGPAAPTEPDGETSEAA